ncbi:MAG: polysaccharide biosynthesis/export family protein, partial [Acidobacteriaceae bacterium]
MKFISGVKPNMDRQILRPVRSLLMLVTFLPVLFGSAAGYAQYAGPAPTKADSPNPESKNLVQRAPVELLPGRAIVLHPGDLIAVSVYGVPEYKINARIAGNGVADLPLVGGIDLAGLTVEQAQQKVAQKLVSEQMILYPDVLISVQDSMVDIIGVMGEV